MRQERMAEAREALEKAKVETLAMELQRNMGMSLEDSMIRAKAMLNFDPDVPVVTQYVRYVTGLMQGNFGVSMQFRTPVMKVIGDALDRVPAL